MATNSRNPQTDLDARYYAEFLTAFVRGKLRDFAERPAAEWAGLRDELDVPPDGTQGAVIHAAHERARGLLRAGEPFAWNATNFRRMVRESCVNLFAAYRARVRVVHPEAPEARLHVQNRRRTTPVPGAVIERLHDRWEAPDPTEAHRVDRHPGDES